MYQSAADAYLQSVNKGKTALLVSPTWNEIEAVTEQVRNALKAQARLSVTEHSVTALDSLSWTEAQKRNVHQYEPGQKILFLRDGHGFAKNQTAEVVEAGTHALRVKKEDGTTVELNPARLAANSVDVCLARELKVSRGDKLLLQANDRPHRLVNGQIVEVDKIENGQIHLADGRTLPPEYRRFCHGYAVTSHASQGKTVDDVFLVASSKSFAAVNREQFYVSISRGREHCHVFTDDKELLQRRVGDSRSRAAALDLVKLREALAEKGFSPRAGLRQREQPANRVSLTPGNGTRQRVMGVEPRPVRAVRSNRLSVAQRLAKIGQSFRDWKQQKTVRRVQRVQREQVRQQEQIRRGPVSRHVHLKSYDYTRRQTSVSHPLRGGVQGRGPVRQGRSRWRDVHGVRHRGRPRPRLPLLATDGLHPRTCPGKRAQGPTPRKIACTCFSRPMT